MIANLFHAPVGEGEAAIGCGTVGSSEAIMLAGLAFKRKWQHRRRAQGLPTDKHCYWSQCSGVLGEICKVL
ncbi:unnamed protein product [Arabidopsis halleri]